MPDKLHADVLERLQHDAALSDQVKELVLAALIGEVEECLGGKTPSKPAPGADEAAPWRTSERPPSTR